MVANRSVVERERDFTGVGKSRDGRPTLESAKSRYMSMLARRPKQPF